MPGEDCLLHFPWWKIHLGDVVTNILCIQALDTEKLDTVMSTELVWILDFKQILLLLLLYQILRRKKVQVVLDL